MLRIKLIKNKNLIKIVIKNLIKILIKNLKLWKAHVVSGRLW